MGALEEEIARVCGLSLWQEEEPAVPTEAALKMCCLLRGVCLLLPGQGAQAGT